VSQQLPFTGSGSLFPAIFGGSCLLGGALLALRHRRTIWTMRK
jgi:LPXTG-motif cell wall-anchored protein